MKVNGISPIRQCASYAGTNRCHYRVNNNADLVSFKGGPSYGLIMLVAKEGYNTLKNDINKAKFKTEIAQRLLNPDVSENGKKIIDAFFALAKTNGAEEPKSAFYLWNDKFVPTSITNLRIAALKNLFRVIPEMKSDANSGNAAKLAMLNSMFDSAEYIYSYDFYHVFKTLPSMYEKDKESLIKKAFHDKNIHQTIYRNYIYEKAAEETGWKIEPDGDFNPMEPILKLFTNIIMKAKVKKYIPRYTKEVESSKNIAEAALLSTMDYNKHRDFFEQYKPDIQRVSASAFKNIEEKLLQQNGVQKKNLFYEWYKHGFTNTDNSVYEHQIELQEKWHSKMNIYEQALSYIYFMDFMDAIGNNITAVMKKFNVDRKYGEDLIKDYNLLKITKNMNNEQELHTLYKKRIKEKMKSDDENINNSSASLIYLSRKMDAFKQDLNSLFNPKYHKVKETFEDITRRYNFMDGNYQLKIRPGEYQSSNYNSIDVDNLESWERADLETPWYVR